MNLKAQVAIITGAARGLGLLVAEGLAAKGMNIAGVDLRGPELEKEMTRIASQYAVETLAACINVGDERAVVTTVQGVVRDLGPVDVLVNNAGIRETAPVWKTDSAMWDRIHDSNVKGHFLFTREVLSQSMLPRGKGTLIFVSSGSGKKGEEISSAYCASKWAIIGFAESVAKDLKNTKIRVTSVTPGMIETPMAHESEEWKLGMTWLNPAVVAKGIIYCIDQDPDTIIPEFRVYHRAQI
jgi:3-oxoacyl-[acyl-carrier protein] reductase